MDMNAHMMHVSLFLAKLLGLYFLITGFVCLLRRREVKETGKELVTSRAAMAVSAEVSLIFGLVIAVDHPIWTADWRGLVTLLGYLMILRGIVRFGFPVQSKRLANHLMGKPFTFICLIMFMIGLYLTYCGFTYY